MPAKGTGTGIVATWKGYRRITRRGPWRDWLEHRKVVYEAAREFCYYPINGDLPEGMTVDHLNHQRNDNRLENLILLDKRIHDHLSSWTRWNKEVPPAWVTSQEQGSDWAEGRE